MPVTEPIEFSFDAPTWSLGKSMAAHISMGRIGEVYHKDLKDTIYQICGGRDEQWEMISTRKDRPITTPRYRGSFCASTSETSILPLV